MGWDWRAGERETLRAPCWSETTPRTRRPSRAYGTPWHLIPQLRETRAVLLHRNQPERRRGDLTRQQWLPRTKRDRANLDDQLVEQSGVVELSHQPATTDQPEILPLRGGAHVRMDGTHIALHKPNVCPCKARQLATGEDPCRLVVWPRPRRGRAKLDDVAYDPCIGR